MFALNTVYWVLSVVFTFLQVDSWNNIVTACYGSDNAFLCIVREVDASRMPTAAWLLFFENILLVNVSTVQYRVPASYPHVMREHSQ
jgi:hypothetical protein